MNQEKAAGGREARRADRSTGLNSPGSHAPGSSYWAERGLTPRSAGRVVAGAGLARRGEIVFDACARERLAAAPTVKSNGRHGKCKEDPPGTESRGPLAR